MKLKLTTHLVKKDDHHPERKEQKEKKSLRFSAIVTGAS